MNLSTTNAHRRVLVIDDNRAIHEDFIKIFTSSNAGSALEEAEAALFGEPSRARTGAEFHLDSAYQGLEGIEKVRQAVDAGQPFAMAFVDVRMPPGLDGVETTSRLWQIDPDLQIVICTAYSDYSWDEMIARVGQSDRLVILKKPFDNIEVLQLANALTEKWRLIRQVNTHIDDLERAVAVRTSELRESEERFRLIAENMGDLIAVVDPEGRRLYNSPSYERVLGYSLEELRHTSAFAQVHPDDRPIVMAAAETCARTGLPQVLEYRMQHKDGSWRYLESHGSAVRSASGQVERLVVVSRDITGRKKAEQERQSMEVQLRHAQKLESIGQLAAGIAHEINTPTQFIGDNLRFLKDSFDDLKKALLSYRELMDLANHDSIDPDRLAHIGKAVEATDLDYLQAEIPASISQSLEGVDRVARIVRAMKDFSHPDAGDKHSVDLNQAIESTATVCRNEWKYVAELKLALDPQLPPVPCVRGDINQVVLNLIINAAHAIGEGARAATTGKGEISVSTRHDGDWAEIRVGDTGTGIPEAIRGRVFDPFFTTKPVGKGTGQGLFLAHNVIVEKHGGSITFESEPGKGTTFIIRLPLTSRGRESDKAA